MTNMFYYFTCEAHNQCSTMLAKSKTERKYYEKSKIKRQGNYEVNNP